MPAGNYVRTEVQRQKLREFKLKNPVRFWLGKKLPKEHRQKLSESHLGQIGYWTGKQGPTKGVQFSKEHKEKISKALKGIRRSEETRGKISKAQVGKRMGDKNNLWKGGITSINLQVRGSHEYGVWRKKVFQRDGFKCQKCNDIRGGNLVAHHIKNFADCIELRLVLNNGVTLCGVCHNAFHKKYGKSNNTQAQLDEFLTCNILKLAN